MDFAFKSIRVSKLSDLQVTNKSILVLFYKYKYGI